ncbi:SET domain-containing protein, partial [Lentithecium fluviatile CBS 122367]
MHNCLFHGELAEGPQERASIPIRPGDTNTELANPKKSGDDSDSDIEGVVNYRRAVNARTLPPWNTLEGDETSQIPNADGKFQGPWEKWAIWWDQKTNTSHWEFRKPFYPCSHEGTCEQAQCRCFRDNITCEKSCGCSLSCIRRFPGCSCAQDKKTRPCQTNCPCRQLLRECDPDLCGNCGAAEILDPINRHNEDVLWGRCRNVALQRGVPKKTLLGHSEVHGFGLYTGEAVKRGDLLGEYKGEIITRAESQRRSIVYGHQQTMYLFDLNLEQEIDSTHFGNKTRFINNSSTTSANCSAENRFCNTVHRLGLFAKKNMKAGTELFFNY